VAFVLDVNGNGIERYTYDAFGKPTITDWNGNGRTSSAIGNRFMFQGREYFREIGLYDYRHRFYDPYVGRFIQTDPMGLQTEGEKLSAGQKALFSPGGSAPEAFGSSEMNLFRYCGDDPVDGSDPWGLFDTRREAAADALKSINQTSKDKNAEYGGLTYVGADGKHYATAARTDGAGTTVNLRLPDGRLPGPGQMGVPRDAKKVDGDYHTHATYSRAIANRRGVVGAPLKFTPQATSQSSDDYRSDHFSRIDIREAIKQFKANPDFRRYLGTPSNQILMYDPRHGEIPQ
jgi:RHS repeat-associated protein